MAFINRSSFPGHGKLSSGLVCPECHMVHKTNSHCCQPYCWWRQRAEDWWTPETQRLCLSYCHTSKQLNLWVLLSPFVNIMCSGTFSHWKMVALWSVACRTFSYNWQRVFSQQLAVSVMFWLILTQAVLWECIYDLQAVDWGPLIPFLFVLFFFFI